MFSWMFSRRIDPPFPLQVDRDAPLRLDEARLAAWALALGQVRPVPDMPMRRRHRGQLPDVDFANAVPAPRRPRLFDRLRRFAASRGGTAGEVAGGMSGGGGVAIGEAAREHYVPLISRDSALAEAAGKARQNRHAA